MVFLVKYKTLLFLKWSNGFVNRNILKRNVDSFM